MAVVDIVRNTVVQIYPDALEQIARSGMSIADIIREEERAAKLYRVDGVKHLPNCGPTTETQVYRRKNENGLMYFNVSPIMLHMAVFRDNYGNIETRSSSWNLSKRRTVEVSVTYGDDDHYHYNFMVNNDWEM